jgi:molybdopterin converting factor small subunit
MPGSLVRVLAFAGARDVIGSPELELDPTSLPSATAGGVLAALMGRWPALAPYEKSLRVAVNGVYAALDEPVAAGDEVAIIPPVAGG